MTHRYTEDQPDTPVFCARRSFLENAAAYQRAQGLKVRTTSPRRDEGLLKVCRADAPLARRLLHARAATGRVMEAAESRLFFCPACSAAPSLGAVKCPACGRDLADYQGR